MIYKKLEDLGYKVIKTREPGGTDISEKIRDVILDVNNDEMSPRCEALLYAASRAQHTEEKIIPYLNNGYIAVSSTHLDVYKRQSHIFAFSGLHVGLVFLFIKRILKPFGKNVGDIISLIILFLYIYILGFPVSAVRAFIMVLCLVLSRFLKFKYRSIEIILISMVFQFAYNQMCIRDRSCFICYDTSPFVYFKMVCCM